MAVLVERAEVGPGPGRPVLSVVVGSAVLVGFCCEAPAPAPAPSGCGADDTSPSLPPLPNTSAATLVPVMLARASDAPPRPGNPNEPYVAPLEPAVRPGSAHANTGATARTLMMPVWTALAPQVCRGSVIPAAAVSFPPAAAAAAAAAAGSAADACPGCVDTVVGPATVVGGPTGDLYDSPFSAIRVAGVIRGYSANQVSELIAVVVGGDVPHPCTSAYYLSHNYLSHDYLSHNYISHNYISRNYYTSKKMRQAGRLRRAPQHHPGRRERDHLPCRAKVDQPHARHGPLHARRLRRLAQQGGLRTRDRPGARVLP